MNHLAKVLYGVILAVLMAACSGITVEQDVPLEPEDERRERRGKLTGEGGFTLFGGDEEEAAAASGGSPIGVNSFLWRATLDTLSFMPLASADPFGGVVITDWYENPETPGERFKVNAVILDDKLRADGIRVSAFKQKKDASGSWSDAEIGKNVTRDLENAILTRARQLRIRQLRKNQ